MKLFDTIEELADSGYLFRIQDNGGRTADRYTVVFCDGDYLSLSENPSHPQGVSMWGENANAEGMHEATENGQEVELSLGDLPEGMGEHILFRVNEAHQDFLDKVEARDIAAVAPYFDYVVPNDGTRASGGFGIYISDGELWVAFEGDAEDNYGPFTTAAEALRATLPQDYAMAELELHPTISPNNISPSLDVQNRIASWLQKLK